MPDTFSSGSSSGSSHGDMPGDAPRPAVDSVSMLSSRRARRPDNAAAYYAEFAYSPSPFWPLLLVCVAVASWAAFQTVQLAGEKAALDATRGQQEQLVQNSVKMRQQLDAIASQTQVLADRGNPNAKLLVDDLKKRGVTINPNTNAPPSLTKDLARPATP